MHRHFLVVLVNCLIVVKRERPVRLTYEALSEAQVLPRVHEERAFLLSTFRALVDHFL